MATPKNALGRPWSLTATRPSWPARRQSGDAARAQAELEESLRLLRTDHLDLYQFHGVTKLEDVDTILSSSGAMQAFLKAREQGKIKYIGFSAHSEGAALKLMDGFDFDTVLFPLNVVCIENGSFGPQVLQKAKDRGVQCLALKAMAWTSRPRAVEPKYPKCWYEPIDDPKLAALALRYTLDLPVVAAVPPGDWRLFETAVEAALNYRPLKAQEREELLTKVEDVQPIFTASG